MFDVVAIIQEQKVVQTTVMTDCSTAEVLAALRRRSFRSTVLTVQVVDSDSSASVIFLDSSPFGISVFVVKSALKDDVDLSLNDIFTASLPFAALMLLVLVLVILFPGLALFFQK